MVNDSSAPTGSAVRTERRSLPDTMFVSLAEALTWIAFGDALTLEELQAQFGGECPIDTRSQEERFRIARSGGEPEVPGIGYFEDREAGREKLENALDSLLKSQIEMCGRSVADYAKCNRSLLGYVDKEPISPSDRRNFVEFDLSTGDLRRSPDGRLSVTYKNDAAAIHRGIDTFLSGELGSEFSPENAFLEVEVERNGLLRTFPRDREGTTPANRQLDHKDIIHRAVAMRAAQPRISIGSAAASIVAELPNNRRTGKPRNARYIERLIAHLWQGGFSEAPP